MKPQDEVAAEELRRLTEAPPEADLGTTEDEDLGFEILASRCPPQST